MRKSSFASPSDPTGPLDPRFLLAIAGIGLLVANVVVLGSKSLSTLLLLAGLSLLMSFLFHAAGALQAGIGCGLPLVGILLYMVVPSDAMTSRDWIRIIDVFVILGIGAALGSRSYAAKVDAQTQQLKQHQLAREAFDREMAEERLAYRTRDANARKCPACRVIVDADANRCHRCATWLNASTQLDKHASGETRIEDVDGPKRLL